MNALRALATVGLGGVAALLATAGGCGTDAVGIEDCREIEQARCEAGEACGIIDDVPACRRYYRDHCLHGLLIAESPGEVAVEQCVETIKRAGECGSGAPVDCSPSIPLSRGAVASTGCDIVRFPEQAQACAFLIPVSSIPEPDAAIEADTGSDAANDGG